MWDDIAKSTFKDVVVAVATAAILALLRRFLPFLPGKVRESDEGPFYRNTEPAAPKSFGQDVALYLFRLVMILITISMTLEILFKSHGPFPNLRDARLAGRFFPPLDLSRSGAYFKLSLMTLVPFVIAERSLCLFIWWLGGTNGYTSQEFRAGTQIYVMFGLCFALTAHLVFFFRRVDYGGAWLAAAKGWGAFLLLALVTSGLQKKKGTA